MSATKRFWMILLCAALVCACTAAWAEAPAQDENHNPVEQVNGEPLAEVTAHDESHRTVERAHGEPWAEKTGSMETHVLVTVYDLYCEDCGQVIREDVRREETQQPHDWYVTREEPTCTEPGRAVRRCAACGEEDVIEIPAVGHCFMWVDVKQPNGGTESQYVCTVCGYVAETRAKSSAQMNYNSTVTSFGPTTRELIGGGVWNRVTPLNLEDEGLFTYPLIAGNQYTVGTATVINENGRQVVSYKLNTQNITVHSESLVIYPSLEALRTGENAVALEFNRSLEMEKYFGDDQLVLMAITLTADFDPQDSGIQSFREDKSRISALSNLID